MTTMADLAAPAFATLIALLVFGYLLGSIPFGLVVTRLAGMGDIRTIGSGNIGATNVLRTGNKLLAALTLLGDAGKGAVAVLVASRFGPQAAAAAGLGAFLGHLFPVWLNFKGGKGVATYLGVLVAFAWPAGLAFAVIWLAIAFITRYSSLAALIASAATPIVLAAMENWVGVGLFTLLTALVFIRHHANLGRLMRGEESRIGQRKT
jgi:acyl phosphate:glycerol-3-phosphate acyltransferase